MLSAPTTKAPRTATIDWKFDTFGEPQLQKVLEAAQGFCNEIHSDLPARWLTILGSSGTGKSHLSKRIYKWVLDYGCRYTHDSGARLCRSVKKTDWRVAATNIRNGDWDFVEDLKNCWFLFIDDIGAEHTGGSGVVKSTLEAILDARMGKWTLQTANMSRQDIADQIDPRIASRMKRNGNVVVTTKGTIDYFERK